MEDFTSMPADPDRSPLSGHSLEPGELPPERQQNVIPLLEYYRPHLVSMRQFDAGEMQPLATMPEMGLDET